MAQISFSGLASGLDTAAIINSLVDVQRIPILRLEDDNFNYKSKIGIIDQLSSALSNLRTKATDLDSVGEFLSFTGSVAQESAAKVTASGDALPGSYNLTVTRLATAQRTYTNPFADKTAALSASDQTLSFTMGGNTTNVTVPAGSSLEEVAGLINGSAADVRAGIVFDGTSYRLQISGEKTGLANAVTFGDTGLGLGFNTYQQADDAVLELDGHPITSADNVLDDLLPGVTIELTGEAPGGTTLSIAADTEAVQTKLKGFVDAYNAVFSIINAQVGEGKGAHTLNGDSTLRTIELGLARAISSPVPGLLTAAGDTMQLSDLGIKSSTDGTLTLDTAKLDETLAGGFTTAASYFAGEQAAGIDGMGEILDDLIASYVDTDGLLRARKDGINALVTDNERRMEELERYISNYQAGLEQQYTMLESAMSAMRSQQSYLAQFVNSM
jgi:flagellar hook-associated protein 2